MEEKLIAFIISDLSDDPDLKISAETKLISSGIIDSFSLVALQAFIEREFGKNVPPQRITPQTFDSVRQMVDIINEF